MTTDVIAQYKTNFLKDLHWQMIRNLSDIKTEKKYQDTLELIRDIEVELCWRERANGKKNA